MTRIRINLGTNQYLIPLRVVAIFGFFFVTLIAYFLVYNSHRAGAQTAIFYPTSCLGGWKNVENATGTPEVADGMVAEYNDENSASIANAASQIFCGGFKGKILADALQKRILVKFSWAERNNDTTADDTPSDTIPIVEEINDGSAGSEPSEIPINEEVLQEESSGTLVPPTEDTPPEISPETEPVSPTSTESSEPTEPESAMLNLITKTAHAETIYLDNDTPDARLEVFYTVNGQDWKSLGFVKDIHNGVNFEMPTGIFTTVEDLEKVQIAIHTVPNYDNIHAIYLDSIWLEIEYEDPDAQSARGITNFKIFVLSQDKLETEINKWLSRQENIVVDELKVEDYGGGGYLVVISYHPGGIFGKSTARLKLITGENPEADAQTFLATLLPAQTVRSIGAIAGSYYGPELTVISPVIFLVYEE